MAELQGTMDHVQGTVDELQSKNSTLLSSLEADNETLNRFQSQNQQLFAHLEIAEVDKQSRLSSSHRHDLTVIPGHNNEKYASNIPPPYCL
jgi:dynactin complex subunit